MTLEEFYHLSKEESFKRIKEECRSQAKRRLCWSLICLLILIVLIIYIRIWNHREFDIADDILTCMYVIICILAGWVAVNNFWLLKKVDNIDTPEQLLHAYEKTLKRKVIF